jgi:hypothetical protein
MRIAKNKGQYLLSVSLFSFTLCKINCIAPQCRVFHKETREDKEGEGIGKKPITKYAGGKTQPKPRLFSLSSPHSRPRMDTIEVYGTGSSPPGFQG